MALQTLTTRRRRRAFVAAASLSLVVTLAACGGGTGGSASSGGEPQQITFTFVLANPKETYYETLAKDFEAANPGVKVKTNKIALTAADQTIPTQLQGGNGPDVFWLNAGSGQQASIGQLGKAGLLLELPQTLYSGVPQADMAGYDINGKVYGVPTSSQILGIIWNDDLAKGSGVNLTAASTMDQVISQCAAVAAKGKSVFGLAGSVPQNNGLLAATLAVSSVYGPNPAWNADRAAGKTTFAATDGWKRALQTIVDMNQAGCFQKGAAGAGFDALTNGAGQGKFPGFFAPGGATKDIMEAAGGQVKLTAMPMPAPQGSTTVMTVSANTGLAGNARTKSPQLVQKFLAFSVTPAEAKKIAEDQGSIPIGATASADLLPQYQPIAAALEAKATQPFPVDGWPNGEVYNALGTGVTGLLTGQKTVDDVLKAMDAAWG